MQLGTARVRVQVCPLKFYHAQIVDVVAWVTFKVSFNKKFVPDHVWIQKLSEFEQLKQGSMIIQQYEIRFTQLSRFAPNLVATRAQRILRFVRGLNCQIYMAVTSVDLPPLRRI